MCGNIFSESMVNTLLFQAFSKSYLIDLINLLINNQESDANLITV
jgi:hypothetical protein